MSASAIATALRTVASVLHAALRCGDASLYLLISSTSLMVTYILVFRKRRDHARTGASTTSLRAAASATTASPPPQQTGTYTQTASFGAQTSPKGGKKRYQRQDSASSVSSSGRYDQAPVSTSAATAAVDGTSVNGESRRRSGQAGKSSSPSPSQSPFTNATSSPAASTQHHYHPPHHHHHHEPLPFAVINRNVMRRDSFEMPQRTIIDSPRPSRSRSLHKSPSDVGGGSGGGGGKPHQSSPGVGGVQHHPHHQQQYPHESPYGPGGFQRHASFDSGRPRQTADVYSNLTHHASLQHHQHHNYPAHQHHYRQASFNEGMASGRGMSESHHSAFSSDIGDYRRDAATYDHRVQHPYPQAFPDARQPASFHDMRAGGSIDSGVPVVGHAFHKYTGELRKGSLPDFRGGPPHGSALSEGPQQNPYRKGSMSDDSSSHYSADSGPMSMLYIRSDSIGDGGSQGVERLYSPEIRGGREEYLSYSQDIAGQQGGGGGGGGSSTGSISPSLQGSGGKSKRSFPRTNPNYTGLSRRSDGQSPGSSGIYRKISSLDGGSNNSGQYSGGSSSTCSGGYDTAGYIVTGNGGIAQSMAVQTSLSLSDTYANPQQQQVQQQQPTSLPHSHSGGVLPQLPGPPAHARSDSDASHSSSNRGYPGGYHIAQQSQQQQQQQYNHHHQRPGQAGKVQQTFPETSQGSPRIMVSDTQASGGASQHVRLGSQASQHSGQTEDTEPDYANVPSTPSNGHDTSLGNTAVTAATSDSTAANMNISSGAATTATASNSNTLTNNNSNNNSRNSNGSTSQHDAPRFATSYGDSEDDDDNVDIGDDEDDDDDDEDFNKENVNKRRDSYPDYDSVPELESDSSSVFSPTPRNSSHQYQHTPPHLQHSLHPGQQSPAMSIPSTGQPGAVETQHASLRRRKGEGSSPGDRSQSLQVDSSGSVTPRPLSMVVPSQSDANMAMSPSSGSLHRGLASEGDMEHYSQHLNKHKKGLFGKKLSLNNMLTWSKDPIQKPMIRTTDKTIKKEACEMFKNILLFEYR
ncbi:rho GTPase-activating protein 39 [Plakobranchus ocellatus]|uniref:Rho GTPase-activating protein 39 n=1 Tax=Plakobranchus ocellatus TaxID=259542 RepID=A0AAV3ZWB2_9GAST|nr:rho GTPase-activating protein 39 [Plakobranchus ocellatus]